LRELNVGYVLALKPSHAWYHPEAEIGSFQEAAQEAGWERAERPGRWIKVMRTFRDGSSQDWWTLELDIRPFGPDKPERVVVATTDPVTLPDLSTFYLIANLPVPFAGIIMLTLPQQNCPRFQLSFLPRLLKGQKPWKKRSPRRANGRKCPGPRPCERSADGSNPGSCSNGFGRRGRHSPHRSRSSSSLSISGAAPLSPCMPPIDPSQQSCDKCLATDHAPIALTMTIMDANVALSDLASCATRHIRAKLIRRVHRLSMVLLHKHIMPMVVAIFKSLPQFHQ
jgi:hypothetical protein